MSLLRTLQVIENLDSAYASGARAASMFEPYPGVTVGVKTIQGDKGSTDFMTITVPGTNGKLNGGDVPTLGIIGRLGGIGARPGRIGLVSDADGAIAALAAALQLAHMTSQGDRLQGDVIITTHICPNAPTRPHKPVDFMDSPVGMDVMNEYEVTDAMDVILSIDATKGNRIVNHKGIAISPTVKCGWILPVSTDLVRILEAISGMLPITFPLCQQDITPYGNGLHHLNSIMLPSIVTDAPVVGIAICTQSVVPGCGTGANHEIDIALAARFAIEVAKDLGHGSCEFYDQSQFDRLVELYGTMHHLQK